MVQSFEDLLAIVPRLVPDGDRIASRLAASTEPARVVDVLCDRPRPRTVEAPCSGKIVETSAGPFIRTRLRGPSDKDLAVAIAGARGNPLGAWAGDNLDAGWLVPAPATLLVRAGTKVEAGTPFATCVCTLDQLNEIISEAAVLNALCADLPELALEDASALGRLMCSYVEAYASHDDERARIAGVLVSRSDFKTRRSEFAVARPRTLGVGAIAALRSGAPPPAPSFEQRLLARLGVRPDAPEDDHYLEVSKEALSAALLYATRGTPEPPFSGWRVVASSSPVESQTFGYYMLRELAEHRPAWLRLLWLPASWSFVWSDDTLVHCEAPDGTVHSVD